MRTVPDERLPSPIAVDVPCLPTRSETDGSTGATVVMHWSNACGVRRGHGVPRRRCAGAHPRACGRASGSTNATTTPLPYLQAIAAGDVARTDHRAAAATTTARDDSAAPAPLRRPSTPQPSRSAAAAVLARSSGHCEVFTESCRYTCDRYVNRCRKRSRRRKPFPRGAIRRLHAVRRVGGGPGPPACHPIGVRHRRRPRSGVGAVSLARVAVGAARPRRVAHRDQRRRADRVAT